MKIERFEDMEAWQLARELTRMVYRLTRKPAFEKDFGLKRQIQEAAGSAMYEQARRTRAAIRGFINYLVKFKKRVNEKFLNREPRNREPLNPEPLQPF